MMYRKMESSGDELSLLGYGCMRFPRRNGRIDKSRAEKQIIEAINNGVNYFDTAYMYSGSEELLGEVLSKGYRDKVKIATKMPIPMVKTNDDLDKLFETQLKRLKTDYIDYYLLHNLFSFDGWNRLKECGVIDFIKEEKSKGRIKNIGFSYHGNSSNFKKIIDDYTWDFCMVQYNYIDENYQAGSDGIEYASSKGLGVIAMEPLRGGMLVNKLPDKAREIIDDFKIKKSPAEWAFRWVGDNPNIQVVLSGMNTEENIKENIETFSNCPPNSLSAEEKDMLKSVKEELFKSLKVNCTNCGYCLPCPQNVDIPLCFSNYNDKAIFGGLEPTISYIFQTMNNDSAASNCIKCGICEKKCPQHIPIIDELENVKKDLEKWYLKIIVKIVSKIMFR